MFQGGLMTTNETCPKCGKPTFTCDRCGETLHMKGDPTRHPETFAEGESAEVRVCDPCFAFLEGAHAALRGGTDRFAVPIRIQKGRMIVGDPDDREWTFDFAASPPMTPPTRVYLPRWIFDDTDHARKARLVFRDLADVEFLAHDCDRCGGKHQIIVRGETRLVDLPCC